MVQKDSNRLIGCMGYYDHSESNIGIDEGEAKVNYLSELYKGDERPVKIMRLDYSL